MMPVDINRYFGRPFLYGGRGPEAYDCAGLLMDIYRQRGIVLPEQSTPELRPEQCAAIESAKTGWHKVVLAVPWCAVAIRAAGGSLVSHVGVVLADCRRFIHTSAGVGVTITRLDDPMWLSRIEGYYVWPI